MQKNQYNRPCLRAYSWACETFCLCGLSEGQGLHGRHTTPSLIVSRTASLRHPAVQLAASSGAPTGQTQQGPWAAGRLPVGPDCTHFAPGFCVCVHIRVCLCSKMYISAHILKHICVFGYLCVFLFSPMSLNGRKKFSTRCLCSQNP